MYLKSLELQGFKSFPDKVKLTFDKGLTAVVGPNGSGKSNIGDSVRWVLGEQSTKTLRGNKMEDVIFSGTVARKPVGFAMVTLVIDNADRVLNCDDDEVSVTRKLYRSGESEYRINGKSVRLKDLNELFMDTGMGRDGYSIIGQGRIAEIVSAKSSERRDIFEEAAGISKFRYKKAEAERKLTAAQDNLIRLNDIVAELEDRIGPLKLQAEKAEKFVVLAQKRKTLEISVWVDRLQELKAKLDELENELLINKNEYENIQSDIEREEQKIRDGYLKIQESSANIDDLRDKILENEQLSSQYKSDIAVSENDISHSEGMLASVRGQLENRMAYEEKLNADIKEKIEFIENLEKRSAELKSRLSDVKQKFDEARTEAESIGKNSDRAGNEINALYIKLSEFRSEVGNSEAIAKDTDEQLELLVKQKNQVNELVLQYGREKAEISDGIKVLEEKKREIENKKNGLAKLYNDKSQKLAECKKECENIVFAVKEKEQRKKLLSDLESNMEGFARSVREIIKASASGRIGGIRGTVAQLINVRQEYAVAIETALGGAMQNIIVDDDTAAKRSIRMLKEQRLGRATFLPVSSVKGRLLNEPGLNSEPGFISMANELVEYDSRYTGIVSSLLGRTAVADDIDSAAVIAKKFGYKFRIVTLDGQVVNAGGSFTGGSAVHSAGVFSRKNEMESIDSEVEKLRKKYEQSQEYAKKIADDVQKLSCSSKELDDELAQLEQDKIKFDSELSRVCALEKQTAIQEEDFDTRYRNLEEKKRKTIENKLNAKERLDEITGQIRAAEETLAKEQGRRESVRNRRESLSVELSDLKIKSAELAKDLEAAKRERETLRSGLSETKDNLSSLAGEQKRLEQNIEEKHNLIAERTQQTEDIKVKIEQFNNDIKKWQNVHREQDTYVTNLRNSVRDLNDAKEKYSGEISKINERKISQQRDFDGIVSQLYEVYEMTRSEAEKVAEKIEDRMLAQRELNDVKMKIRGLGNVNVGAIEEYKEVSGRYRFLSDQLSDVRSSKRELEKLISDLTEDMCRIFAESFVIINNNFKQIFTELFGGGKAELILTDPENVLESGIEIRVAPPGKVIKNLISLSGGEQSFVAICIYFAILKLKPAPFCILDEIDAALDEVNVKKYAQYLKNFTDKTQFVLVTHRRSAMEEANVLYGVTMQEDGISRLLKMEQTDISE